MDSAELMFNSPSRTRTYDLAVNSRSLYQLSYRGFSRTAQSTHHRPKVNKAAGRLAVLITTDDNVYPECFFFSLLAGTGRPDLLSSAY